MEKTKMSKKQFVIYMTVAFGLAWILEIIASIFSNNGNQMIFTSILMIAMFMPFVLRIPVIHSINARQNISSSMFPSILDTVAGDAIPFFSSMCCFR